MLDEIGGEGDDLFPEGKGDGGLRDSERNIEFTVTDGSFTRTIGKNIGCWEAGILSPEWICGSSSSVISDEPFSAIVASCLGSPFDKTRCASASAVEEDLCYSVRLSRFGGVSEAILIAGLEAIESGDERSANQREILARDKKVGSWCSVESGFACTGRNVDLNLRLEIIIDHFLHESSSRCIEIVHTNLVEGSQITEDLGGERSAVAILLVCKDEFGIEGI